MTDNEIIKALKRMASEDEENFSYDVLNFINRQNAEIERLNVELVGMRGACESYKMHYDNAQAEIKRLKIRNNELNLLNKTTAQEAIKEFADRIIELEEQGGVHEYVSMYDIEILVKEMTE